MNLTNHVAPFEVDNIIHYPPLEVTIHLSGHSLHMLRQCDVTFEVAN